MYLGGRRCDTAVVRKLTCVPCRVGTLKHKFETVNEQLEDLDGFAHVDVLLSAVKNSAQGTRAAPTPGLFSFCSIQVLVC